MALFGGGRFGRVDAHRSTACPKVEEFWGYDVYAATPDDDEAVALQSRQRAADRHPGDAKQIGQGFLTTGKGHAAIRYSCGLLQ